MADNKVTDSIETPGGERCVDLFQRPNGSWGFEEYRRDVEDGSGWFKIGFYGDHSFVDRTTAIQAAKRTVTWFSEFSDKL